MQPLEHVSPCEKLAPNHTDEVREAEAVHPCLPLYEQEQGIGYHGDINQGKHRILRLSEELLYAELLFGGLEEQLDPPYFLVELRGELLRRWSCALFPCPVRDDSLCSCSRCSICRIHGFLPERQTEVSPRPASRICPNTVLYLSMSVIPYVIRFCTATKLYLELQTLNSTSFILDSNGVSYTWIKIIL